MRLHLVLKIVNIMWQTANKEGALFVGTVSWAQSAYSFSESSQSNDVTIRKTGTGSVTVSKYKPKFTK